MKEFGRGARVNGTPWICHWNLTVKSIHELSMTYVCTDVIGKFWRKTKRELQWRIQVSGAPGTHAPSLSNFVHFHAVFGEKNWSNNSFSRPHFVSAPGKSWIRHWIVRGCLNRPMLGLYREAVAAASTMRSDAELMPKSRPNERVTLTTRMHSSRMRTARTSSRPRGLNQAPLRTRHPWIRRPLPQEQTPQTRHHPGADPPDQVSAHPLGQASPGTRYPPCEQNDRQVQKYYLAPNFVCGR